MRRFSLLWSNGLFLTLTALALGCHYRPGGDPPDLALRPAAGPAPVIDASVGFGGRTLSNLLDATVEATNPPPPLSGGTLLLSQDGTLAVVSDPERDQIDLVDIASRTMVASLALQPGDEPGRAVEDSAHRVHVVLRSGRAVATVDLATRTLGDRSTVCPLPRGIAYDSASDAVLVACAGGELVTLPAAGGAPIRTVTLDQDLRDVMVVGGVVYVTRFREAELLTVGSDGQVSARVSPAIDDIGTDAGPAGGSQPTVAWRAIPTGDGHIAMLHQYAQVSPVSEGAGGYSLSAGGCGGSVVQSAITVIEPGVTPTPALPLRGVVLGIDLAISPDGQRYAVTSTGNLPVTGQPQVIETSLQEGDGPCTTITASYPTPGQTVAVAYSTTVGLLAQTREPAALYFVQSQWTVPLASDSREDTGHTLFHANAGGSLACASCHPEGTDDGHVWNFDPIGPRRTQSLRGNLLSRAPFHWDGDLADMPALVTEVFASRMSGGALSPGQVSALGHWLNALAPVPAPALSSPDQALVARGQQLFMDPTVGCSTCHAGPLFTTNALMNVGTGGTFKVPSLVGVVWRPPYLHNGCAATLIERFTNACAGGDSHGHTSQLASTDRDALVAYLRTL